MVNLEVLKFRQRSAIDLNMILWNADTAVKVKHIFSAEVKHLIKVNSAIAVV